MWGAPSLSTGSILINNVPISVCVISIDQPCREQAASYWLGFGSAVCDDGAQSLITVETWVIKTGSLGTAKGSLMSLRLTNDYKPAALSPNSEKGRENIKIWRYGKDITIQMIVNLDG